jgi:hypothetical protein
MGNDPPLPPNPIRDQLVKPMFGIPPPMPPPEIAEAGLLGAYAVTAGDPDLIPADAARAWRAGHFRDARQLLRSAADREMDEHRRRLQLRIVRDQRTWARLLTRPARGRSSFGALIGTTFGTDRAHEGSTCIVTEFFVLLACPWIPMRSYLAMKDSGNLLRATEWVLLARVPPSRGMIVWRRVGLAALVAAAAAAAALITGQR